jgi:hypothetical protein
VLVLNIVLLYLAGQFLKICIHTTGDRTQSLKNRSYDVTRIRMQVSCYRCCLVNLSNFCLPVTPFAPTDPFDGMITFNRYSVMRLANSSCHLFSEYARIGPKDLLIPSSGCCACFLYRFRCDNGRQGNVFISSQPPGLHQLYPPSQLKELPEKQLFSHKAAVAVFVIVRPKT